MTRVRRAVSGLGAAAAVAGLAVTGVVVLPTAVTDSSPAVTARRDGPAAAVAAVAAAAGRAAAASASPASTHPAHRSNVGNTHSPRLLHQLAGPVRCPAATAPPGSAMASARPRW